MDQDTLIKAVQEMQATIAKWQDDPPLAFHTHTGYDMNQVFFSDISQRKAYVHHTIQGAAAATAANYGVFFIAPVPMVVAAVTEVHQVKGTDGGTVSLNIEKLTSGTAPDSGATVLSTALSLKTNINVPQNGTITTTTANASLAVGDRLCMKDSGTLTAVSNVTVMVELTF